MIGRSSTKDDTYHRCQEEEEEFKDRTRYLADVGALLYLATFTRPDISFTASVLARHSQKPPIRHWRVVKHVFRYLRGTEDLRFHYVKTDSSKIIGYADVGYKSDVNTDKSQTGYIFLYSKAPISWKSVEQTVTTTSTNHSELIAFQEATREVVWLRNLHMLLITKTSLNTPINPIIIYTRMMQHV